MFYTWSGRGGGGWGVAIGYMGCRWGNVLQLILHYVKAGLNIFDLSCESCTVQRDLVTVCTRQR